MTNYGVLGISGGGKTQNFITAEGLDIEPRTTFFLALFPKLQLFNVLNKESRELIKIGYPIQKHYEVSLYDFAGNPLESKTTMRTIKEFVKTLDIVLLMIDGTRVDESISELEQYWMPMLDNQLKAVMVSKLDLINLSKEEIMSKEYNDDIIKCFEFAKEIKSSYFSLATLKGSETEEIILLSNYMKLNKPIISSVGGSIVIPTLIYIKKSGGSNLIEKAYKKEYENKRLI